MHTQHTFSKGTEPESHKTDNFLPTSLFSQTKFKWQVFGMDLIGLLFLLLLWGFSLLELLYCSKVGRHVREGTLAHFQGTP